MRSDRGKMFLVGAPVVVGAVCCLVAHALAAPSAEQKRAARQLVEHALEHEASGEVSSKQTLLAEALKQLPDFAPARWQSGFVKLDNRWTKVDEAPQAAANSLAASPWPPIARSALAIR